MDNNKNIVDEEVNEVEEGEQFTDTPAEPEKKYTDADVDAMMRKKDAIRDRKIRREYEEKYKGTDELLSLLEAGTGKKGVDELKSTFTEFYKKNGVDIPEKTAKYSQRDLDTLARADAEEYISLGDDEVAEEVDRLANIGVANMSEREKAKFKILAEHRSKAERVKELKEIGVTEEEYDSADFKEFAKKFDSKTPMKDVYDIYSKTKPQKNIKQMGSMKSTPSDNGVKDFYTPEEARSFTLEDFNKNPALYKAVEKSMLKWKK